MTAPDGPLLRLDGIDPLADAPAGEGALGSDPFDTLDVPDPVLEALSFAPPPAAPPEDATRRPPAAHSFVERWMGPEVLRRLEHVEERKRAEGAAYTGFSPELLRKALPPFLALYRAYFRVESSGHENLPRRGPALLVANHAGLLPFDGAMATLDVFLRSDPPRIPRAIFDRFAGRLGPIRRFFEAAGAVMASRENLARLLREGNLVLVFPEGMDGIVKPIAQRYRLQHFHTGFVRQALALGVPVVPIAIAGSDDQAPILYDVKSLARRLGLPVAPITPTFPWLGPLGLLPYPVRYRIVYGEPMDLRGTRGAETARDDRLVAELSRQVRARIQHLLDRAR